MAPERVAAFAPGRVNLIGEHTDYNGGLALPFAIAQGVVVSARRSAGRARATRIAARPRRARRVRARATARAPTAGARSCAAPSPSWPRPGAARPARACEIGGDLPRGAGLSSSAALEVALCLALLALDGERCSRWRRRGPCRRRAPARARAPVRARGERLGRRADGAARPARVLFGARDSGAADRLPQTLDVERRAAAARTTGGFVVLDSGERHAHASCGYNERRAECAQGRASCSASRRSARGRRRSGSRGCPNRCAAARATCSSENERVRDGDRGAARGATCRRSGACSTPRTRACATTFEISTPAVEATVARLRDAGAAGARLIGGGFGGCVLALFAPGAQPPPGAIEVRPGPARTCARPERAHGAGARVDARSQARGEQRAGRQHDGQRQRRERAVERRRAGAAA